MYCRCLLLYGRWEDRLPPSPAARAWLTHLKSTRRESSQPRGGTFMPPMNCWAPRAALVRPSPAGGKRKTGAGTTQKREREWVAVLEVRARPLHYKV